MLMTGRYSLGSERDRKLKRGTPHLGQLFKENGYVTGVFGKDQPLHTIIKNADITEEQRQQEVADRHAYKYANFGADGVRDPGQDNKNFFQKGHYKMFLSPLDYSYDYHYTSTSVCCQPGGFFEHGVGVKPFDKFAVQRPYPEGSEKFPYNGDPLLCKGLAYKPFPSWMCREFTDYQTGNETVWKFPSGYVGPPYFKEPTDGPILMGNYPSSILVQEGYDGRDTEGEILPKALDFIAKHADGEEPFFMYYGLRSGHRPFNAPERFRGTTAAGEVGEMVAEVDDNIGQLFAQLEKHNIDKDTILIFMSDNGADQSTEYSYMRYGHMQNAMDWRGSPSKHLRGTKNLLYEGGHRNSFMWRWPRKWAPKVVNTVPVSYIDVYATLADVIGSELTCNEAPDSRSLLPVIEKDKPFLKPNYIVHHAVSWIMGNTGGAALRMGDYKWIPSTNELFNLKLDLGEKNNLFEKRQDIVQRYNETLVELVDRVATREERTELGKRADLC